MRDCSWAKPPCSLIAGRGGGAPSERLRNNFLRTLLDAPQMIRAQKTFGVNFVYFLGTRGACRKPSVLRGHLNSPDRVAVSGSRGQNLLDFLPGNFGGANVGGGQLCKGCFLLQRCGGVDAFVDGIAEVSRKV